MRTTILALLAAACVPSITLAQIDPDLLAGLKARSIGPAAVSGRIAAIDAVASDPNHIVVGVATGGVWVSRNGGLTWKPVFDDQPVASIGAVAINQLNPDIIWVGTGEGNTRNSTSIGGGLFKSVDGGNTWNRVGLERTERINRIALHPSNPDIAYAAALGTLWGENSERGIFRTTDGGDSWSKILYVDEKTGGTDVKLDPFNPDKVYASMWQHRRWPWFFKSGGPGSGVYISWDGGDNWTRKTEEDGLPAGELGRITFSPSPAQKNRVYALVEAEKSAMVRSDDGGVSWQKVNEEFDIAIRPFYYTEVAADPRDPNRVYNIATLLKVSIDGGKTFTTNPVVACCAASNTIHIDNHAFWINPNDPQHLILGNDGGIAISADRGETWRYVRNLPLSQFYHVAVDDELPYNVYGGLQDNGSWRGPSNVWENGGIRNLHWQEVSFGDGFDTIPQPDNARAGYSMFQGGNLMRWNLDTGELRMIRPAPPSEDVELRFNWDAAIAQDPFDANTIYYGSQFVHKSSDRGATWTTISGDLTSNNPEHQTYKESGGLTPDVTAAENYTTLVAIGPSPLQRGLIWTGSDDGRVHITRDGGENWERIDERARGVNPGAWVPMVTPSPHEAGTAFVVFDDHRRSDMTPYVYKVEDFGRRWTRIAEGLSGYALSVIQDHVDPDLLFVGTEFGLWFSTDGGGSWTRFTQGLPTVSVMDMAVQRSEEDLVLGTHGRSLYIIDDYSALRGLRQADFNSRLSLLSVKPGQQYVVAQTPSTRFTGSGEFRASNEPYGVTLTFMASGNDLAHPDKDRERDRKIALRSSGKEKDDSSSDEEKIEVTVSDSQGEVIRTFRAEVHQGINRVSWGLVHDGVRPLPGPNAPEPDADLPAGAQVPPGEYTVTLSLGDDDDKVEVSTPVTVRADPRLDLTPAQRETQYRTLLELRSIEEAMVSAVEGIDRARKDLQTVKTLIARHDDPAEKESLKALNERVGEAVKSLDDLEKAFRLPPESKGVAYDDFTVDSHIDNARFYVGSSFDAPTETALDYVESARRVKDKAVAAADEFLAGELADLRAAIDEAGIRLLSTSQ